MVTRSISPNSSRQAQPTLGASLHSDTQEFIAPKSPLEKLAAHPNAFFDLSKFLTPAQYACMRAVSKTLKLHTYAAIPKFGLQFVENTIEKITQLPIDSIPNGKGKGIVVQSKNELLEKLSAFKVELQDLKDRTPSYDDNLITVNTEPADLLILPRLNRLEHELNNLIEFTRALNHLDTLVTSLTTHYSRDRIDPIMSVEDPGEFAQTGIPLYTGAAAYAFIFDHINFNDADTPQLLPDAYQDFIAEIETTLPRLDYEIETLVYFCIAAHTGVSFEVSGYEIFSEKVGSHVPALGPPLWVAYYTQNLSVIEHLLKFGINPNSEYEYNAENAWSLLDCEAKIGWEDTSLVEILIKYGANINIGLGDDPPLYSAITAGNFEIAQYLVNHGANLDTPPNNRVTWRELIDDQPDSEQKQQLIQLMFPPMIEHLRLGTKNTINDPALNRTNITANTLSE